MAHARLARLECLGPKVNLARNDKPSIFKEFNVQESVFSPAFSWFDRALWSGICGMPKALQAGHGEPYQHAVKRRPRSGPRARGIQGTFLVQRSAVVLSLIRFRYHPPQERAMDVPVSRAPGRGRRVESDKHSHDSPEDSSPV